MVDYLPQEVLIEILTRVPIKSLVRFRLASQSWNSLITSHLFITSHLHLSLAHKTNPLLLLRRCFHPGKSELFSLRSDDASFDQLLELELPYESVNKCFNDVGSCNGVVCFLDDFGCYTHNLILWNPSIRKALKLPPPAFSCHIHGPYIAVVGFGFDSRFSDYKVVRLVNVWKTKKKPLEKNLKRPVKVEIYSTNAGCWRTLDVSVSPCRMHYGKWDQAFVNGVIHWLSCREVDGKNHSFVLSFDLSNESFGEMMLPESLAAGSIGGMSISVFELSLVVIEKRRWSCDVWMMKEYGVVGSWTKYVIADYQLSFGSVAFRNNGELLMAKSREMVSYNPQSKAIDHSGEDYGDESCFYASSFIESLGLLNSSSHIKLVEKPSSLKRKFSMILDTITEAIASQTEQGVNSNEALADNQKIIVEVMDRVESLITDVDKHHESLKISRTAPRHQMKASLERTDIEITLLQDMVARLSGIAKRFYALSQEGIACQGVKETLDEEAICAQRLQEIPDEEAVLTFS